MIDIPKTNKPRILIIGGGFAGINFAKTLSQDYQVVMLDKNNYHTFIPLLYQVATAGLEPSSIAVPIRQIFKGHENFIFRVADVSSIINEEKYVKTSIGDITYDYLVIAIGTKTNFYNLPDFQKHSFPMKSLIEALNLRSIILQRFEEALITNNTEQKESLITIVIVGGGPTGVEITGALAELKKHILSSDYPELDIRKVRIHIVEMLPKLLASMSPESSIKAKQFLEELGVTIWLNTGVKTYDGSKVELTNGELISSRTVIWSAGVMGADIAGIDSSKIAKINRIKVDEFNRIEGYKNVFAIGDIASMILNEYPVGHPMLAPVAIQQGLHLGMNFTRLLKGESMIPFKYKDPGTMATIGRNKAVVDLPHLKFQGMFAWLLWVFVHLMKLVGFRNKLIVFINWAWNYFSYDRGIRLIIRSRKD